MIAQEYSKSVESSRKAWRSHVAPQCMCCANSKTQVLQIHEIERRSACPKRWAHTANYLLLCPSCHLGPFAIMAHAPQLAYKLVTDPEHFNLNDWLRLRDPELKAPDRVTLADIALYLRVLRVTVPT